MSAWSRCVFIRLHSFPFYNEEVETDLFQSVFCDNLFSCSVNEVLQLLATLKGIFLSLIYFLRDRSLYIAVYFSVTCPLFVHNEIHEPSQLLCDVVTS